MPFTIGLTGGIGCGKSRVAENFAKLGAAVIDTDKIARALTGPNSKALDIITAQFGDDYRRTDGSLDRARLRHLIFTNAGAKAYVEALLHPLIRQQVAVEMATLTYAPYQVIVVPLLLETHQYQEWIHRILVVDCDEAQQISRTMARSGLTEAEVRTIMRHQISRETRRLRANDIITNKRTLAEMEDQVIKSHRHYVVLAHKYREERE